MTKPTITAGALAVLTILLVAVIPARGADLPRIFAGDPAELAQLKQRLARGETVPAYDQLLADADKAMKIKPASVMDKPKVASSGDKHDYASFAPYFWPNPDTKDGLPYVQRDGSRNRELVDGGDAPRFERLLGAVNTLALAYYLSGRDAYAEHAALLLHVWFIDSDTKMKPNFDYAQAVPGRNDGRGIGLIEFRGMYQLVDALNLLDGNAHWTLLDRLAIRGWMEIYWQWLQTSKNARDERAATNNHGVWFDVQEVSLALYVGKEKEAKSLCENFKTNRIDPQIRADGQMPRETARADGWGYTLFNLKAMTVMACLSQRVGVDLWHHQGTQGQSIRKALDYAVPYLDPANKWPFKQTNGFSGNGLASPLLLADRAYGPGAYKAALDRLGAAETSKNLSSLGYAK